MVFWGEVLKGEHGAWGKKKCLKLQMPKMPKIKKHGAEGEGRRAKGEE